MENIDHKTDCSYDGCGAHKRIQGKNKLHKPTDNKDMSKQNKTFRAVKVNEYQ